MFGKDIFTIFVNGQLRTLLDLTFYVSAYTLHFNKSPDSPGLVINFKL